MAEPVYPAQYLPPVFDNSKRTATTGYPTLTQKFRHLINKATAGSAGVQPLEFSPNLIDPVTPADFTREGWGSARQSKLFQYGRPGVAWYNKFPGHTFPWEHLGNLGKEAATRFGQLPYMQAVVKPVAQAGLKVAPGVGTGYELYRAGKLVGDIAGQAGEYLKSPDQDIRPEFIPPVAQQMMQIGKDQQIDLEERIGYNEADTLRQHGEIVRDPRSSSLQRSQSAQTLIESVANRPYIAPFISGGKEVRSSTEKVLDAFLPSAFNIKNIDQVKSEILGNIDFDLEMETEITPQTPEQYLQSIEDAGAVGEQIVPRGLFTRKPLRHYMPEYLESTGPEPDVAPSIWYTGEAPEVRTDLTADQAAWDKAIAEGNTSGDAWIDLKDRHDTRRHLDAVFGTDTAGSTDPTLTKRQRLIQTVGDMVIPNLRSDTLQDAALKFRDNKDRVQTLVDAKETSAVSETLKDLVNNELFMGARDTGQGALEAYNNPNVVFDDKKFDVLSQALVDKKANIDQLDSALELVRSAPEDDRVVESFTEQGLIDIGSQVESFTPPPPRREEEEEEKAPAPKKVKKAKTQVQTTKARKAKKVKDVKVKSIAKTSKVTKSAASQALSRARGNVKDANKIAKITKSFTAAKNKDSTVYMPTIRKGPTGAWIGGF